MIFRSVQISNRPPNQSQLYEFYTHFGIIKFWDLVQTVLNTVIGKKLNELLYE